VADYHSLVLAIPAVGLAGQDTARGDNDVGDEQKLFQRAEFPEVSQRAEPSYTSLLEELNVAKAQRETRQKLLGRLENKDYNDGRCPNAVVAHIARESLDGGDVPVLGSALRQIGDVDTLNLILDSPGGEGTCVEKVVSLCRAQCERFRVIIPNEAKSAATMIALGADEIVMGPCSELGPIDAQVPVIANGLFRLVSAQSFIDARDALLKSYAEAKAANKDTQPVLQMLASLDIPFIEECQRMMDFGRDVAGKLLSDHMFHKRTKDRDARIAKVVATLSSVQRFKVHGRLIDGNTARRELQLSVRLLGKDDPLWKLIWEYYTRAGIALSNMGASKMFETRHEILAAMGRPVQERPQG